MLVYFSRRKINLRDVASFLLPPALLLFPPWKPPLSVYRFHTGKGQRFKQREDFKKIIKEERTAELLKEARRRDWEQRG